MRSREVFEYELRPRIIAKDPDSNPAVLDAAGAALSRGLYGAKADDVRSRQALLFGWREVDYLTALLSDVVKDAEDAADATAGVEALFTDKAKKALSVIRESAGTLAAGLEAALFGRMVTSDPQANTDAALHVAHAFTVHEQESETDYFTVVDDLKLRAKHEDSGSAGIFDTELTSGLYYGYVVVDIPLLVANITGARPEAWSDSALDRELPAKVIEHLVHLVATVSPGAKKGSTAPYAFANTVLLEAGSGQPRSLASAFESPVRPPRGVSVSRAAETALLERLRAVDRAYGGGESRRFLSLTSDAVDGLGEPCSIGQLAEWAAERVRSATV